MANNTFRISDRKLKRNIRKAKKYLLNKNNFPTEVFKEFKRVTPKGDGATGGNAKRKTKLKRIGRGYQIRGEYPYSGVIDKGLYPNPPKDKTANKTKGGYSKKNLNLAKPDKGLVEPALNFAKSRFRRFLRRLR